MRISILLIFFFSACTVFSQNVKGIYVDGFSSILGNTDREDSLLRFAENNGFNYLTLYEMHIVNANTPLTNSTSAQTFANFVEKAKTQYSITQIGVASENFNAFNTVYHIYNQQHSNPNQRIDVYNLEFEFWVPSSVDTGGYYCQYYLEPNGIPCDTAGGFVFFKTILHQIDSLAALDGVISEVYFGWFNDGQGAQIVQTSVDRILLSAYLTSANYSPSFQYNYLQSRLERLASANQPVKLLPLYSAETDFMHDWTVNNPFFLPYSDFISSLNAETGPWKQYIHPEGIQWFTYSDMPKKNMDLAVHEYELDEFSLYPNPNNGHFTISATSVVNVQITDLHGHSVQEFSLKSGENQLDLSKEESGVYFVKLSKDGQSVTKKVMIDRR